MLQAYTVTQMLICVIRTDISIVDVINAVINYIISFNSCCHRLDQCRTLGDGMRASGIRMVLLCLPQTYTLINFKRDIALILQEKSCRYLNKGNFLSRFPHKVSVHAPGSTQHCFVCCSNALLERIVVGIPTTLPPANYSNRIGGNVNDEIKIQNVFAGFSSQIFATIEEMQNNFQVRNTKNKL